MKKKFIWLGLSVLIMITMLLASCSSSTTTSSQALTTTNTIVTNTTTSITNSNTVSTTTAVTTTSTGNFWDSLGVPQYGGTITITTPYDPTNFDPYGLAFGTNINSAYMERLFADNWTVSPSVFSYYTQFRGNDYTAGQLAQSWEFTDPNTFVVQLRQNVYWQNIPPANGRQFVASDIVAHYMRWYDSKTGAYDLGGPHATPGYLTNVVSITATGNFTVTFKWKTVNPEFIYESLMISGDSEACIEDPEAVAEYGNLNDWHDAIGTGPFMLTDFVDSSSATFVKNPNYWGYDERYPQNKLPYVNGLTILVISNNSTALAAMRTGKIEALDGMSVSDAQAMQKTNPNINQITVPLAYGRSIDPRVDVKPFSDMRVREALQVAINLKDIAQNYYLDYASPDPMAMTSSYMTGWGFPYSQWPQDLKAQYTYNPTQAKALLATAGYPNGFNTDIVVPTGYDMDLLKIIQSDFAAINVNMSIQVMDYSSWNSFVQVNHKEDALASNSTGSPIGRTTEPLTQMGTLISTQAVNFQMVNDPVINNLYTQANTSTTLDGVKQALMELNQYVAQQNLVISLVQPITFTLIQPWFKGYNGQNNAISGPYGPSLLFFYPARFWVTSH